MSQELQTLEIPADLVEANVKARRMVAGCQTIKQLVIAARYCQRIVDEMGQRCRVATFCYSNLIERRRDEIVERMQRRAAQ